MILILWERLGSGLEIVLHQRLNCSSADDKEVSPIEELNLYD
jgi:hypothetical protein